MKNVALIKLFFLILFCTECFISHAQKGKISGKVFSVELKNPIAGANIKLLNKDSLPLRSQLTDSLGNFSLVDIPAGSYVLRVEALSYSTINNPVYVSKNKNCYDTVFMQPSYQDLQSVVITAKKPTVVIKTDTTEFTASSFKTNKNATVEDIFKKMPDVEVSKNGTIKVQGETVTQIYVDGKPFFGSDLNAVTQNFPADMIDKIQIIDKKSDQAMATKVDDGSFQRIINITLKKSLKKGVFGNGNAGYGTSDRYETKANANFFNDDKKLSAIAGINNTSNNNGIGSAENKQVKISYADKFRNIFDFSAWVGFNENNNTIEQFINRQNIFFDSSTNYFENNKSNNLIKGLYGGLYFEYKPDTLSFLRFNESANYINGNYNSLSRFNTIALDEYKINEGNIENSSAFKTPSLNGQISYNRRLSNSGRNVFINFSNFSSNNELTNYNNFNNHFFPTDTAEYILLQNQLQYNNNRNRNIGTTINYTEPIALNHTLNLGYEYNYDKNNMPKEVYDLNEQNDLLYSLNDSLSYDFFNDTKSNTVSANYNYTSKKIGFGAGVRWKQSLTESYSYGKDTMYQQSFRGLLPNLNFYSVSKRKRLNIYYNSFIQTPQPYQLQPLIDNISLLYVRKGNPALKYAVVHMLRYNFKYYNTNKQRGFNSNASFASISNNVGSSVSYDNITGKQISQPINTDNAYRWNTWFSYFSPLQIKNDKLKWNVNLSIGGSKINNLLNGEKNGNRNTFTKIFFGLTYDSKDWLDFHTNVSMTKQVSKYSLQNNLNNSGYYLSINPVMTIKYGKNAEVNIDYDYRKTTSNSTYFNTSVNMLNINFTEYLNSKKDMWLSLKAYNVLNQNVNIWQTFSENFVQEVTANGLSRYLLLTVNFRLNKIKG